MFRVTNIDNKENTVVIQGAFAQNSNVDVASLIFQNYDHDTQQRYDLAEVAVRDAYGSVESNGFGRFIVRVSSNDRLSIRDDKEFTIIQPGIVEIKSGVNSNAVLKVHPTVTNESNATMQLHGSLHIAGHLVPTECNRYDLGTAELSFRDGYFSGNTVYLGDTAISTECNGDVIFKNRQNPNMLRRLVANEIQLGTSVRISSSNNQVAFITDTNALTSANFNALATNTLNVTSNTTLGNSSEDVTTINSTLQVMHGMNVIGTVDATAFSGSGAALTGLDNTNTGVRTIATSNYVYSTLTPQLEAVSNAVYQSSDAVVTNILTDTSNVAYTTSNYSFQLLSSERPANAIPYWDSTSSNLQFDSRMVIKDGILGIGASNPSLGVLQLGGFMYLTQSQDSLSEFTYDGSQIVPQATAISNTAISTSNYVYSSLLPLTGGTIIGNVVVNSNLLVQGAMSNSVFAASGSAGMISYDSNGATNSAIYIGRAMDTNRSINANGSINALSISIKGADYSEYMMKKTLDFTIAKGDICGITSDGLLTDRFSESISFVVKSTDPGLTGNIGCLQADGAKSNDWYDRIALCGQVPVNVFHAQPGDYILPIAKEDDTIGGIALPKSNVSFEKYLDVVGKVIRILEDGRAFIFVKM